MHAPNPTAPLLASLALLAGASLCAAQEPLPARTDIPADFSTVICPGEAAAATMLRDHYAPAGNRYDIRTFMAGLKATGCVQASGPITIERVQARRRFPDETVLFYAGRRPGGQAVFGHVWEEGFVRHPRNHFERWLDLHAKDGKVPKFAKGVEIHVCPTVKAAQRVVAAIPPVHEPGVNNPHQVKALKSGLRRHGCKPGAGPFTVSAVHKSTFISRGNEAGEEWASLTATNTRGENLGLVHGRDPTD